MNQPSLARRAACFILNRGLKPTATINETLRVQKVTSFDILLRPYLKEYGVPNKNAEITIYRNYIARYEAGRVPGPLTLLAYARLAHLTIDDLVDDKKNLPKGF